MNCSCFLARATRRTPLNPRDTCFRSVSDWCWIARRSPWAAAFPPCRLRRGLPLLFGCFIGNTQRSDSAARTRPPFGFAPSLTGLHDSQTRRRSPGSRACCFSMRGPRPRRVPLRLAMYRSAADVAFHLCKQGRHAVRSVSGPNRPARRCLYLRFAVRLATHHARLKVRIESLLLFCMALSASTTCRFIPAHSASPEPASCFSWQSHCISPG